MDQVVLGRTGIWSWPGLVGSPRLPVQPGTAVVR